MWQRNTLTTAPYSFRVTAPHNMARRKAQERQAELKRSEKEARRRLVLELHAAQATKRNSAISRQTSIPLSTIRDIIKTRKSTNVSAKPQIGRPSNLSERCASSTCFMCASTFGFSVFGLCYLHGNYPSALQVPETTISTQ